MVAAGTARAFNVARQIRAGQHDARRASAATRSPTSAPAVVRARAGARAWPASARRGAFGGYKQSGLGREWGRHGLEEFTEIKSLSWT